MANRLFDRDDVTRLRFTRAEPRDPGTRNRNLLEMVDSVFPGGTVFHVYVDTPDDTGDLMAIVVDGATIVHFELPLIEGRKRRTGGWPRDVKIEPLDDFRWASGQRSHRLLDLIAGDACREMNSNGN